MTRHVRPRSVRAGEATSVSVSLPFFQATVTSNSRRILEVVRAICPVAVPLTRLPDGSARATFGVTQLALTEAATTYTVTDEEKVIASVSSLATAITFVEYLINSHALAALHDQVVFHAGVVARPMGAILFPGSSRMGKSTLIAALCLSGFGYVSDELAIVDPVSLDVAPYLKAVRLRVGGWEVLAHGYAVPVTQYDTVGTGSSTIRHLLPSGFTSPGDSVRIRWICLPKREPGAPVTLNRISRTAAFAELARHSLTLREHGPNGVEALARLVEGAECYSLVYDDLASAVAKIAGLSPSDRSPHPDMFSQVATAAQW